MLASPLKAYSFIRKETFNYSYTGFSYILYISVKFITPISLCVNSPDIHYRHYSINCISQ